MKKYFIGRFGVQNEIQNKLIEYLRQMEAMALDMEKAVGAYLEQDRGIFRSVWPHQ